MPDLDCNGSSTSPTVDIKFSPSNALATLTLAYDQAAMAQARGVVRWVVPDLNSA